MKMFFRDLVETFKIAPVWWYMAYQDLMSRYRRTTLGPWWITLGTGIGVGAMGFVWGSVFNIPLNDFFPYMTAGFILWGFISSCVLEGALIYTTPGAMLRTIKIPLLTFIFTGILRNLYTLLHNIIIVVIVFMIFQVKVSVITLLFVPGLFLVLITAFLLSVVLGILGARFRDLSYTISSLMTFLFMLTPVMWNPKILTGKKVLLAYGNPFTYFLAIVRDPLLNTIPDSFYYIGVFSMITVLLGLASFLYERYSHRLVYWV